MSQDSSLRIYQKRGLRIYRKRGLRSPCLVVGWGSDAGNLGPGVADYLMEKLRGEEFGEIEPAGFFPLSGVSIENDVAQFPESKFYSCQRKSLVVFKSSPPRSEWYRFLNLVLDVAERYCHVKELYTVGGMVSLSAHTAPRELLAIANSPDIKPALGEYELARDMDYETPPGQRPTLSSFLMWLARGRKMAGASLWVPVPFYLVPTEDPRAWRRATEFLDRRLGLELDLSDMDEAVTAQDQKIARARAASPEIDSYIQKLESSQGLTQEQSEKLVREMEGALRKRD